MMGLGFLFSYRRSRKGNGPPAASIRALLLAARVQVRQTVNTAMVQTYWHIGRMIVEDEQGGQKRAAYGKQVLPELAKRLSEEFGAGFDVSNLRNMRQFFQFFPNRDALRLELTWTHYRSLIRIDNRQARDWYAKEAAQQGWSVRALERRLAGNGNLAATPAKADDWQKLATRLSDHLGYPSVFKPGSGGAGELRVKFHDLDELDGLLARIGYREV